MYFERFSPKHLQEYASWFSDEELNRRLALPTQEWLRHVTQNPRSSAWLAYENGEMIAQVQLDTYEDEPPAIDISVKPSLRNQGLGTRVLREFLHRAECQDFSKVQAWIETDNIASRKCFEKVGFKLQCEQPDEDGLLLYILHLARKTP